MVIIGWFLRTLFWAAVGFALLLMQVFGKPPESSSAAWLSIAGGILILASPVLAIFHTLLVRKSTKKASGKVKKALISEVHEHENALRRNLERASRTNDYGAVIEDKSADVIAEFLNSVGIGTSGISISEASSLIHQELGRLRIAKSQEPFDASNLPFDGTDFEQWVADSLEKFGWNAQTTTGGGDQGIDVIARKNGRSVALQCKLYSQAVGNKAVQEAFAGAAHYQTDASAVLTNASYTSSAENLAASTGVKLLTHHDIPQLYEKMFPDD